MTVNELIEKLNKIENKNQQVVISVHTATQRWPVAYTEVIAGDPDYLQQTGTEVRLLTWLPDNMHTVERKH